MTRFLRSTLAATALLLGAGTVAHAQSSTGNISGEAASGETIVVDAANGGFHRELTIDKDGKYSVRRVPTGVYVVVKKHADGTAEAPKTVEVHAGVTVRIQD